MTDISSLFILKKLFTCKTLISIEYLRGTLCTVFTQPNTCNLLNQSPNSSSSFSFSMELHKSAFLLRTQRIISWWKVQLCKPNFENFSNLPAFVFHAVPPLHDHLTGIMINVCTCIIYYNINIYYIWVLYIYKYIYTHNELSATRDNLNKKISKA